MNRPDWDTYFLNIAKAVSERATCPRAKVGALIVDKSHHIQGTGYNGAPADERHCYDVGCLIIGGHCKRAVHAEINALKYSDKSKVFGATLYCTITPCTDCLEVLKEYGIIKFIYSNEYP